MEGTEESIKYGDNGLRMFSKKDIESQEGKYDKDGFYILPGGDYYDDQGFYFDKDGYDELGGYYDKDSGEYVAPPDIDHIDKDLQEYADYYDELDE